MKNSHNSENFIHDTYGTKDDSVLESDAYLKTEFPPLRIKIYIKSERY